MIQQEMIKDNSVYLGLIQQYFKTRKLDDFEKDLGNAPDMAKKFKSTYAMLLPVHARAMFKKMSVAEFEEVIKQSDPKKMELIKKKRLKTKLTKLLEELQAAL